MVQIAKTQNAYSVVRNSTFHSSTGFYARWKSSHSILEGNEWLDDAQGVFELQMLPSYFEGPSHIRNVTIKDNVFQVANPDATIETILETKAAGAQCCDIEDFVYSGNRVIKPPPPPSPPPPSPVPPVPPGPYIAGYSQFPGIDITVSDDTAYGGLCTNDAILQTSSVWEAPTALCDLLDCPRFGTFGGNGRPPPGPPPKGAGYCIKGWVKSSSAVSTHSYLSQTRCGGTVMAKTVNGTCNRPSARYTMCPDGAGTTQVIQVIPGNSSAEQGAKACERSKNCVGFTLIGGVVSLLGYGLKGVGSYVGYASFTRIPP